MDWILSIRNYLFSPIRCVAFIKHLSFVFTYPDFIANLEFRFRWQYCSISPCTLKYKVLSFFFLLASICGILMELCLVLLWGFSIFGCMSKYTVLPWTVNCFHVVLIVRFHLSQTEDFSSFSVDYSVMSCFCNSSLKSLLQYSFPFSVHIYCGLRSSSKMVLSASVTVSHFFCPSTEQSNHIWRTDLTP